MKWVWAERPGVKTQKFLPWGKLLWPFWPQTGVSGDISGVAIVS